MTAPVIFVVSTIALLMFFVSYCRSLTRSSSRHVLSKEVRDVTGIPTAATKHDFNRVMQLLRLCPDLPEDRTRLRAIGVYHEILRAVERAAVISPFLRSWAEAEQNRCANFAAVTLDRRIAFGLSRQSDF